MSAHDEEGKRSATQEVEASWTALTLACLNTGLVSGLVYGPARAWVGFMTGNTIQIGMLVGQPRQLDNGDADRLVVLGSFALGCFIVSRFAHRFGHTTRRWLVASFVVQAGLALASAAILFGVHAKTPDIFDEPVAHVALGLLALSSGWQAINCSAVDSPFSSTVVLTMASRSCVGALTLQVTLSLFSDPRLFAWHNSARNARITAILSAMVGGVASSIILRYHTIAVGLCVAAGLQLLIAAAWAQAPAKRHIEI